MVDTPSSILLLRLQALGSNVNLWGGYLNTALQMLEQASKGYQTLAVTGDATISWANYTTGNVGSCAHLGLTGTLVSAAALTFPGNQNSLLVHNNAGATVTIKCSGGTGVAIPNGRRVLIHCNGTDYYTDTPTWTGDTTVLTNNGDLVSFAQLMAAIATAGLPATSGTVLNSAADTTANYLAQKLTATVGGLTTTQLAGLTSVQWSTLVSGGDERRLLTVNAGYVGGFLNGGTQAAQFTPSQGYAYEVNCTSAGVTVNLGGMTNVMVGQEIKLSKYGTFSMFLLGTVNGQTNLSVPTTSTETYRYTGSTWGWN